MTRFRTRRNLLAIAMFVFSLGAGLLAAPITTARQTDGADPLVTLYFLRDGKIGAAVRPVTALPQDISIWDATLISLLAGPRDDEHAAGLRTALLPATALSAPVSLDESTGVATVDLNAAFVQDMAGRASPDVPWRMAQIVATLTQSPGVTAVAFRVDGQPLAGRTATGEETNAPITRADIEELTPIILLERPGVWQQVSSPLHLTGTANTFEAVVSWRFVDRDGSEIGSGWFMATSGTGTRGTFDETIPFDAAPGRATLVLFEQSAMDGSPVNVVSIPVEIVAPTAAQVASSPPAPAPAATATSLPATATHSGPTVTAAPAPATPALPTATPRPPTATPAPATGVLTLRIFICPAGVADETASAESCDFAPIRHASDLRLTAPWLAKPVLLEDFDWRIDVRNRMPIFRYEGLPLGAYELEVTKLPRDATSWWIAPSYNAEGSAESGYTITIDETDTTVDLSIFFLTLAG